MEYSTKISGKQKIIIIYLLPVKSEFPDSAPAKDLTIYQLYQYYLSVSKYQINSMCEVINGIWCLRKNKFNCKPKYCIRKILKTKCFIYQDIKIHDYMRLLIFRLEFS